MSSYILVALIVLIVALGALTIKVLKSISELLASLKKQQHVFEDKMASHVERAIKYCEALSEFFDGNDSRLLDGVHQVVEQLKSNSESLEKCFNANCNAILQNLTEQIANIKYPELKLPEIKLPEIKLPEIKLPEIKLPEQAAVQPLVQESSECIQNAEKDLTAALQEAAVLLRVNQAEFQAGLNAFHKSIDKLITQLPSNENSKDVQKEQMRKFEESIISMQEKAAEAMSENSLRLQEILAEVLKNAGNKG